MRDIKFRGKRVDNGEWVYGYYAELVDIEHHSYWFSEPNGDVTDVIPETVGQYTGLDDRNGVKIYEGDVIHNRSIIPQWDKDLINEIQAVVLIRKGMTWVEGWNENGYIGEEINRSHYACLLLSPDFFEVIGNIHEHNHLLEQNKNK